MAKSEEKSKPKVSESLTELPGEVVQFTGLHVDYARDLEKKYGLKRLNERQKQELKPFASKLNKLSKDEYEEFECIQVKQQKEREQFEQECSGIYVVDTLSKLKKRCDDLLYLFPEASSWKFSDGKRIADFLRHDMESTAIDLCDKDGKLNPDWITDKDPETVIRSIQKWCLKNATRTKKRKRKPKKMPSQFYKDARDKQIAAKLAENPEITAEKLGEKLGCDKSTISRSKAWKNRGTLDYPEPPKGHKLSGEESGPDIEAIDHRT